MSKSGMYVVNKGNPIDNWNDHMFIKSEKGTHDLGSFYTQWAYAKKGIEELRDVPLLYKALALTAATAVVTGAAALGSTDAKQNVQQAYDDIMNTIAQAYPKAAAAYASTISGTIGTSGSDLPMSPKDVLNHMLTPKKVAVVAGGTGVAALTGGCTDDDDDALDDLGEPMKKVNHYVGTEGFNVDVDDIFGEKSIYYLAEQETGAKSPGMEFKPCAKVVEETYLGEDGVEVIKYKIGKKRYDEQQIRELGVDIEDSYLPEDKIHLMIKKLPDGTYDLSDLTKSTEALGWEHISLPGYFEGSDKNPKANDNIIGNNGRKPELREELTPAADGRLKNIVIFNKAYLDKYEEIGVLRVRPVDEFPDKEEFFWANEWDLKLPAPKELFGGDLCYIIGTTNPAYTDALIAGTLDYKYGTGIKKKGRKI